MQQDNDVQAPLNERLIERKDAGQFIPSVMVAKPNSGHMHIDRMQRFFCANIEKQTNEL